MESNNVWNAVIDILSECDFPTKSSILNEAHIVFQYYSELESGGHESLFNSLSTQIEASGIGTYLKGIITALEKMGANDYAEIAGNYGEEMWRLFVALENDEIEETEFYRIIEKADDAYYELGGKLELLLEDYFVKVHTELIEAAEGHK